MDDQQLIAQIRNGDQESLVILYQRYADLIYRVAYRILRGEDLAEECLQDSFMKAWQHIDQYDETYGAFPAWLVGIARNLALDRLRYERRRPQLAESETDDERPGTELASDWPDQERATALSLVIQTLPPEQAQVLDLSYYGGLSQIDIAEMLGLPLGTVKTRMRLAMQKLKSAWLKDTE